MFASGSAPSNLTDPYRARDNQPTTYVVIPVFNRIEFTRACLNCLRVQTYIPIQVIVVDGGSSDGTVEVLGREYPEVSVLKGEEELWWAGAMRLGVEYVLKKSRHHEDLVLMMNNDTIVAPDYVRTLVRVSRERNAAVGSIIVDSQDPTRVLDAGESIDWERYSFPVKVLISPEETFNEAVDVLPGRGTLVPVYMIRQCGNIDAQNFPHYLADYEFFCRLKRHGFRLGVTYETRVLAHAEATGLFAGHVSEFSARQAWDAFFSKKSMDNVRDHWRFIHRCAPAHLRMRVRRRLIWDRVYLLASKTTLRHVVLPLVWFLTGPYYVTRYDCVSCGLDVNKLVHANILQPWRRAEWYTFVDAQKLDVRDSEGLRRLYGRARNPLRKIVRWWRARAYQGSRDHE